ncbi:hypothetical protein AAFF_G00110670 [Aldrovandia affinis]|uniref:Uncharacterized protein n=1 Tax=Aldrovandia affinis TaxID=143900 RepID=A0AAD7RTH4_9TELE|nr:hypothetical protein AAFF_G00110670 [Aldrovandia affinis]
MNGEEAVLRASPGKSRKGIFGLLARGRDAELAGSTQCLPLSASARIKVQGDVEDETAWMQPTVILQIPPRRPPPSQPPRCYSSADTALRLPTEKSVLLMGGL